MRTTKQKYIRIPLLLALLAGLVWALALYDRAAADGTSGLNIPSLEQTALSTSAASGTSNVLDAGENGSCAAVAELTALSGGSSPGVTYKVQTSPNGTNWYDATSHAACTAACVKTEYTLRVYMRYLRFSWATTGTPSTATTNFYINCFR